MTSLNELYGPYFKKRKRKRRKRKEKEPTRALTHARVESGESFYFTFLSA
jgi:hypothetical protein